MDALDCLADETLQAYQSGTANADLSEFVGSHLRECSSCLERLQAVESAIKDPLLDALRRQRAVPVGVFDPLVAASVSRVLANQSGSWPASQTLTPVVGEMLHEYRLLEKLASGGMGTVYRALHVRLDKEVALKVIHPARVRDPRMRQRFGREMKAIGKLRHPNIVLATDAGEFQGVLYLVMELEQGADLARYVRGQGRLSIAEACDYARQAALALQYAHEAGLVHRDVKPSNLFRTAGGQIKLLDLGLSLLEVSEGPQVLKGLPQENSADIDSDPLTADKTLGAMGTDEYMAPEQWNDAHQVDARADLYSLGCTLFFLLTGRSPFVLSGTPSRAQIRSAHAHNPPPAIRSLRPDASPRLEALLNRLLEKKPVQRFASAAEVAEQLSDACRPKSRRAVWSVAAGLALVSTLIVVMVLNRSYLGTGTRISKEPVAKKPENFVPVPHNDSVEEPADKPPQLQSKNPPPPVPIQVAEPPVAGVLPMTVPEVQQLQREWAVHLQRPVTFNNSLGMEMALIPPGKFSDVDGQDTVIHEPYYLAASEVTMRQFRQFVEGEGFVTEVESNQKGGTAINADNPSQSRQSPDYLWSSPGLTVESQDCPVVQVTWNDALAFCLWLSKKERATYRLQTAAEWVWASRAGQEGLDYRGTQKQLTQEAWIKDNAENHPHPVRTRQPNPWGLYDLQGNVGEWCLDDFDSERLAKMLGRPAPAAGQLRIAAGSSYASKYANYRVHATRTPPSSATTTIGFRVVCEVKRDSSNPP